MKKKRAEITLSVPNDIRVTDLTQRTIAILGQKGTGKTYLMAIMANNINNMNFPVIVFDPVGELVRKVQTYHKFILDGVGVRFTKKLKELWNSKSLIAIESYAPEYVSYLAKWILENLKDGVIIFDEISDYLPQFRGYYASGVEGLIKKGRNKNLGFIFASQRPQTVNKNVLALADYFILFRIVRSDDLKSAVEAVKYHMKKEQFDEFVSKIHDLRVGQVILVDFQY